VAIATFTLFAVTINIIPLIIERGAGYGLAAVALGLVGFGQVAGRFGYPSLERHTSTRLRTVILFAAGAVGLWLLALVPGPTWLLIGIGMVAGAVRGCMTLLQATAVSDRWGTNNFGAVNGVFVAPIPAGTALAPGAGPGRGARRLPDDGGGHGRSAQPCDAALGPDMRGPHVRGPETRDRAWGLAASGSVFPHGSVRNRTASARESGARLKKRSRPR